MGEGTAPKSALGRIQDWVRAGSTVVLVASAVAAYFVSRHDVETLASKWDEAQAAALENQKATNTGLEKVREAVVELKVENAKFGARIESAATSTAAIAASAVTQTQMQEHIRAADLEHSAMKKSMQDLIDANSARIEEVKGRVDRLERQQDGVRPPGGKN